MSLFRLAAYFLAVGAMALLPALPSSPQGRPTTLGRRFDIGDSTRRDDPASVRLPAGVNAPDYVFGPGDVLAILIADSPEMSGSFQVSDTGNVEIPLAGQLKAAGLTGSQLSTSISEKLKSAELVSSPIVEVDVLEYHSCTVLVLGAVAKPAVYPLQRPSSLLDVISLAGGLAPNAGNIVTVSRKKKGQEAQSVLSVDLAKVVRGLEPNGDVAIQGGDVINVSTAPIVYVIGAVNKPGGFVMTDPGSGVSVLQAVALAEGLQSIAAPNRSMVLRRSQDGKTKQEFPIDISSVLHQKGTDQLLQPNDVLFVPESGSKKTLHAMGRAAEQGVVGVATYGLGLRVGQ
jgi:polysaccharide export outer membrane protein